MSTSSPEQKEERALLIGVGGMLGEAMYKFVSGSYGHVLATDIDVNEPWLSYLDVRDIAALDEVFRTFKPTIVYNLAALTDLEYCEEHPDEAWATNAIGAENVVLMAEKYGAVVVYISTAGIFGGEKEYFTDLDTPVPLSYYAKAKYHGERYVETCASRYYVFRAGWMMGGGTRKDKKFINKLYKQIKDGNKELHVVSDKLGTPTYTHDFAANTVRVVQTGYYGVYNQVQEGSGSRLDVAREFVDLLGLSDAITIHEVSSDHFAKEYHAPRPYSEKLVNLKLNTRNLNNMRDWREALRDYAEHYRKDYYA
jgi:dTDP-4-dehydrorhamnose reductase